MNLTDTKQRRRYMETYRDGLLNDTLPFWFPRCVDETHGGYLTGFGRDGTLLQTDKSVWFQGRTAWTLANLCNTVEPREDWLRMARHGIEFIETHCFDEDGRMLFSVTKDGRPLRKRRYVFSETFTVIAMAAYAAASGEHAYLVRANELFERTLALLKTPGALEPKTNPEVRPMKGLAAPMILLVTARELRNAAELLAAKTGETIPALRTSLDLAVRVIDDSITEIRRDFMKESLGCVLETVAPDGSEIDGFDGRLVCPGHSIEAAWFILEEARRRGGDAALIETGTTILDWSWRLGWDEDFGGILYYKDARGGPCAEYWHDMKFWWPHNETIIATLLAWQLTGDDRYARLHKQVHDWSYGHFPDPVHGEWFGYLHRDGSLSTDLKGNLWKGPFHLPRMQWYCWQRLHEEFDHPK